MLRKAKAVHTAMRLALFAGVMVTRVMPPARAAEIVTLRSGFTITCVSREAISTGTVRLYLPTSGSTGTNYVDVPASSISALESTGESITVKSPGPPELTASTMSSILQRSGAAHNVSVALLASIIHAESAGDALAVSRSGARGLMQLMPATAVQMGVKQSFEPSDNVNGGSAYLDRLLTRYHENIALALAAYNAGPGAVDRYHGIPPFRETHLYVARVLTEFNRRVRQEQIAHADMLAMPSPATGQTGRSR